MKKAYNYLIKNPHTPYEEWVEKFFDPIPTEDVKTLADKWLSYDLPKFRFNATARSVLVNAIKKYTLNQCLVAIERYNEVLQSDYYMDYIWDVRKFFKQSNAAPDFMDNGVKWLNYQKYKERNRSASNLNESEWRDINIEVEKVIDLYIDKVKSIIPPPLTADEEEIEDHKRRAIARISDRVHPVILSKILQDKKIKTVKLPVTDGLLTISNGSAYIHKDEKLVRMFNIDKTYYNELLR